MSHPVVRTCERLLMCPLFPLYMRTQHSLHKHHHSYIKYFLKPWGALVNQLVNSIISVLITSTEHYSFSQLTSFYLLNSSCRCNNLNSGCTRGGLVFISNSHLPNETITPVSQLQQSFYGDLQREGWIVTGRWKYKHWKLIITQANGAPFKVHVFQNHNDVATLGDRFCPATNLATLDVIPGEDSNVG